MRYQLGEQNGQKYIQCLTCKKKSFHPGDIKHKYCGHCHIFHDERVPKIACDFDGVINSYSSGWAEGALPDLPVPGAIEWLEEISGRCRVTIYSARIQDEYPEYERSIRDWLIEHGLSERALSRLRFAAKISATIYLDDRAVRFTGKNFPTEDEVRNHQTWNATGETPELITEPAKAGTK